MDVSRTRLPLVASLILALMLGGLTVVVEPVRAPVAAVLVVASAAGDDADEPVDAEPVRVARPAGVVLPSGRVPAARAPRAPPLG